MHLDTTCPIFRQVVKVAAVGIGMHEIKIMKQGMKAGFGLKDVFTSVPRHLIPAVYQADEKVSMRGRLTSLKRFGNEGVILTVSGVNKEVKVTLNGKAELTFRKEEFRKCICIHLGKDRASKAAPNSANTNGVELVRVVSILMKGKEATEGQVLSELRGVLLCRIN